MCLNVRASQNLWKNSAIESPSFTMTIWAQYKNERCQKKKKKELTDYFLKKLC